eukprot:TRINITY_DN3095_c0_g1_i12.p1 TRINITY_DN3095_c0_g1~~TRINITY_DN3095_c0_g1_i12.p1  ORF type:complete len:223 (+),score=64.01 TRINITY_DN3095_c0_g1_i12:163-831(+)
MVHPLMALNLCFTVFLFFLVPGGEPDYVLYLTVILATGPPLVVASAQFALGKPHRVVLMPWLVFLHHGLCLNNAIAVISALLGLRANFQRTPKFGDQQANNAWMWTSYAQSLATSKDWPWLEMAMALGLLTVMGVGLWLRLSIYTFPWLLFFFLGFLFIVVLQWREILYAWRHEAEQKREQRGGGAAHKEKGVKKEEDSSQEQAGGKASQASSGKASSKKKK